MGNRKTGETVQQTSEAKSYLIAPSIWVLTPLDCSRFQQNNSDKFLNYFLNYKFASLISLFLFKT